MSVQDVRFGLEFDSYPTPNWTTNDSSIALFLRDIKDQRLCLCQSQVSHGSLCVHPVFTVEKYSTQHLLSHLDYESRKLSNPSDLEADLQSRFTQGAHKPRSIDRQCVFKNLINQNLLTSERLPNARGLTSSGKSLRGTRFVANMELDLVYCHPAG